MFIYSLNSSELSFQHLVVANTHSKLFYPQTFKISNHCKDLKLFQWVNKVSNNS